MSEAEKTESKPKVTVRIAERTIADAKLVQHFNVLHARFEDAESDLLNTSESFQEDLGGDIPKTLVMFAELDGKPVGVAMYFPTFELLTGRRDLWLDDLFLKPESRGHGIGKLLLAEVARQALHRGGTRLSWIVAADNKGGIRFYERLGAVRDMNRILGKVEQAELEAHAKRVLNLPPGYTYRTAYPCDAHHICRLTRAGAIYHDRPELQEIGIRSMMSTDIPPFECFLVFEDASDVPIGICVFFRSYSSWRGSCLWLEYVFVEPIHRRKGIASALISLMTTFAVSRDWHYAGMHYVVDPKNADGRRFLEAQGGRDQPQWLIYRLEGRALRDASELPSNLSIGDHTDPESLAIPPSLPVPFTNQRPRL
eukprot:TRINITY_DN7571_c0_g1_i1.p1 TRINITY_DN7571_c0_g1~~TRINITY_DN7571_c0_g1_i1.p1  ORF type:complete len:368 (-),score=99.15 TRINITY_DN7571_c0_g1_i1:242-1345(-)